MAIYEQVKLRQPQYTMLVSNRSKDPTSGTSVSLGLKWSQHILTKSFPTKSEGTGGLEARIAIHALFAIFFAHILQPAGCQSEISPQRLDERRNQINWLVPI
jgi:hypothetical protein